MAAQLREGSKGNYYGSLYSGSDSLTMDQMTINANYIYSYMLDHGWTKNAIAGMLGNMTAESTLNPGRWQSENVGNSNGGYGLVQWTPATNYFSWCSAHNLRDPSEMDNNLARIIYELENNLQWIATSEYNLSFVEFSTSTESAEYLASAFLKCYERAGVEVESQRRTNAKYWYDNLSGATPENPNNPNNPIEKKKDSFKFVLFNRRRKVH